MVLVLLPLLAMLSSGSRQLLGWTCVNVCRDSDSDSDRSNGDTGHVRVHVQCCRGWPMHAPSVIAPAAALRRRAAVAERRVAVRNLPRCGARFRPWPMALARRAASPNGQMLHVCACNLQCGRSFGRGCLHDGAYRYSTQYVHIDVCSTAQHDSDTACIAFAFALVSAFALRAPRLSAARRVLDASPESDSLCLRA